jgi:hypothetical protein
MRDALEGLDIRPIDIHNQLDDRNVFETRGSYQPGPWRTFGKPPVRAALPVGFIVPNYPDPVLMVSAPAEIPKAKQEASEYYTGSAFSYVLMKLAYLAVNNREAFDEAILAIYPNVADKRRNCNRCMRRFLLTDREKLQTGFGPDMGRISRFSPETKDLNRPDLKNRNRVAHTIFTFLHGYGSLDRKAFFDPWGDTLINSYGAMS